MLIWRGIRAQVFSNAVLCGSCKFERRSVHDVRALLRLHGLVQEMEVGGREMFGSMYGSSEADS